MSRGTNTEEAQDGTMSKQPDERAPLLDHDESSVSSTEASYKDDLHNDEDIKGTKLYLALILPQLGLVTVALEATMTSTVSASIAAEFSSLAVVSWLGSAYLVAVAAVQPISGKLTDRIGRRSGFLGATLFFAIGNLMCAFAPNVAMLVAGRVVAGLGGGAMSSVGVFMLSDLLPLRRRTTWQGLQSVAWAGGMGIGGVFGGLVNDTIGWRWTFIIMIPFIMVVAIGGFFSLPRGLPRPIRGNDSKTSSKPFDVVGSVLLTSAVVCLVLGLNLQEGNDSQLESLVLMIVAAVLFLAFIIANIWFIADPVIPLYLLKDRSVIGVCVGGFLIALSMHSMVFYVPLLIQVRGFSSSQTGLQILGSALGSVTVPPLIGLTMRRMGSYAVTKPVAYVLYMISAFGIFFSRIETPVWATFLMLVLQGGGFGSILVVNLSGLLANIDQSLQASGTSMQYAFRQIGASAGLGLVGIIFRARVAKELSRMAAGGSDMLVTVAAPKDISTQCRRQNYVDGQPPIVCQAYFDALHWVFLFTLITAVLGCALGMLIRNVSLDQAHKKEIED